MFVAPFDHFFKELHLVDLLSTRTRLPVRLLAQACNPDHQRSEEPRDVAERRRYRCDPAIAGNVYTCRLLAVEAIPNRINFRVYNNPRWRIPRGIDRFAKARSGETGWV
jgi:hypothetical protein